MLEHLFCLWLFPTKLWGEVYEDDKLDTGKLSLSCTRYTIYQYLAVDMFMRNQCANLNIKRK